MSERLVARLGWLVALLAVLAYGAALGGDYVFDDVHSVSANPAVQSLSNLGSFWTDPDAFSGAAARMYRPALLTSFALNIAVSPAAWSLKAGNLLIHCGVATLLFRWLWQLSRQSRAAFVCAALFAVHPLASEAINLVSARSELLSTFGVLLGLHAQLAWLRGRGSALPIAGMLLGTVLACGSKETGVVLPGLMLVQAFVLRHRLPNGREWRRLLVGIAPVVALVVAYLVARKLLLGEATVQLLGRTGEDPSSGHGRTLTMQLATMGTLLPQMLWQAVVPAQLTLDPEVGYRSSFADPLVLLGWSSIAGLTVAGLWNGPNARLRRLGTCTAWAIALPWIVIPLNMPFAEHRFYGPLLGFAVIGVGVVPRLRRACGGRVPIGALRAAFALLLAVGVTWSAQRSWLYRDERTLWQQELSQHPESFRAWWGLGTSRMRHRDMAGALGPLQRAHTLYPGHHDALRNYVEALIAQDDEHAFPWLSLATSAELQQRSPDDPWVRTLVAQANLQAGRAGLGDQHFETAERLALSCLEIAPPKGYVYLLAAFARRGLDDLDGALHHLDTSMASGLPTIDVCIQRVRTLVDLGRPADARRALQDLQRRYPTDPRTIHAIRAFQSPAAPSGR